MAGWLAGWLAMANWLTVAVQQAGYRYQLQTGTWCAVLTCTVGRAMLVPTLAAAAAAAVLGWKQHRQNGSKGYRLVVVCPPCLAICEHQYMPTLPANQHKPDSRSV